MQCYLVLKGFIYKKKITRSKPNKVYFLLYSENFIQ